LEKQFEKAVNKLKMKLKVTIAIFVVAFLGLILLLHANGMSSNDHEYSGVASLADNQEESVEVADEQEDNSAEMNVEEPAIPDSIFEICKPAPLDGVSEQIIKKKAYIVSYNKDTKIPNWVAWYLTGEHSDGPVGRSNAFYEDIEAPAPRATIEDYKGSGWSRGHMCPAGDNKWNETAMYDSFSLVNVCPQNANLNSGLWNSLEIDCRRWAKQYGDIYIVCGPVFLNREHETIGVNEVFVPEVFFKVVLCLNDYPKGFGVIVRNTDGNRKRDLYYNSIDQMERITGYDFFPALPDDIENEVESHADIDDWR
jgi:endonuclease G